MELAIDQTDDIVHWPVLRSLSGGFLRRVDKFYVWQKSQRLKVLLVMRDELKCFSLTSDQSPGSALDFFGPETWFSEHGHRKPKELVELRGKTLVQCARGEGFIMVVTSDGDLYGWGSNALGQVWVLFLYYLLCCFYFLRFGFDSNFEFISRVRFEFFLSDFIRIFISDSNSYLIRFYKIVIEFEFLFDLSS